MDILFYLERQNYDNILSMYGILLCNKNDKIMLIYYYKRLMHKEKKEKKTEDVQLLPIYIIIINIKRT